MTQLTDTHCHLNSLVFAGRVGEVVARAQAAGVGTIIVPGWDEESSRHAWRWRRRIRRCAPRWGCIRGL